MENNSGKIQTSRKFNSTFTLVNLQANILFHVCFQCTYHLDPFVGHFDPHKHNGYYMRWFDIWIELFSAYSMSRRTALLKGPKRAKYLRVHAEFNSQTPQVFFKLFPKGYYFLSICERNLTLRNILPLRQTRRKKDQRDWQQYNKSSW